MIELEEMEAVIEAILFVANDPVPRDKLLEVFAEHERGMAASSLEAVVARYREDRGRGMMIDEAGGGLRLVSRPELHGYLRRFFEVSGTNKLTMAALESLAIIAYRQPVTSPEIQELRGVNSSGVIKKLLERRLIRIAGRKEVVGKPFLYATTREFLMHFGLRSLKELPPLEQFEELFGGDLEAEETFGGEDLEEQIDREVATLDEAEAEAAEAADREAIVAERAAAEAEEENREILAIALESRSGSAPPEAEESAETGLGEASSATGEQMFPDGEKDEPRDDSAAGGDAGADEADADAGADEADAGDGADAASSPLLEDPSATAMVVDEQEKT